MCSSGAIWLPSHHPGECCTLVVVEEIPPPLLCKALWVPRKALYKCNKLLLFIINHLIIHPIIITHPFFTLHFFPAVHILWNVFFFKESLKIVLNLIFHTIIGMTIKQHIVSIFPTFTTYSFSSKAISESSRSSVFLSSRTSSSGHTGDLTILVFWTCDRPQTAHHIFTSTIISYLMSVISCVTQQVSCVFCSYHILMNTAL